MKAIFDPGMLDFMMDIRFNNNKAFMEEHKADYNRWMKEPYYRLIEALTPVMLQIDEGMEVRPAKCLSRIFRDTRFSRDKTPYRDHHWLAFRHQVEPRDQAVMFWFEIRVEAVSWGLGFWGENKAAMEVLRRQMLSKPQVLLDMLPVLTARDFVLEGHLYKRRQAPEQLPQALHPWYLRREIYLIKQNINPKWIFEEGLAARLAADFLALAPFYQMLRSSHLTAQAE